MAEMQAFEYGGFYDVPRCISIQYRGIHFVLQSWFDEALDEYPSDYSVHVVPTPDTASPPCSEDFLQLPMTYLGHVPIERIRFDASKRKELDASILDSFVALAGTLSSNDCGVQ